MISFISCDWGTSAFRLRLINADTKVVFGEIKTEQGIAAVFDEWKKNQPAERFSFYRNIIADGILKLEQKCNRSLANTGIVISGMASSGIGMMNLPYRQLPFQIDGSDLLTHKIMATQEFPHPVLFISGVKTNDDVMRGEETKLIGCSFTPDPGEKLIIMPGTHAKHIVVKDGRATDFKTYLTGELFNLLSTKSILQSSVEVNKEEHLYYFTKGVTDAADSNLLNSIFHVRTFRLFDYHSAKQNYHYLSGLLIGSELRELLIKKYNSLTLVATGVFTNLYKHALDVLKVSEIRCIDADEALINGQCKMFFQMQLQ